MRGGAGGAGGARGGREGGAGVGGLGRDGSKKKWPESGHFSFWAVIETPANPMKTEFVGTLPDLRSLRSRARSKRWNTEKTIYPVF